MALSRRQFFSSSAFGFATTRTALPSSQASRRTPRARKPIPPNRPNILLIVADDLGWNDVGYHGSEVRTPNIDALARNAAELHQFYSYPTCTPARASLLTGRNPDKFGILTAEPTELKGKAWDPSLGQTLPKGTLTLAEHLRRQGYHTAITGKWHLGMRPEVGPRQYGFDYSYGHLIGELDKYTHLGEEGEKTWHRNDVFIDEEGHADDLVTAEALRFIREIRDRDKPFFLFFSSCLPHHPFQEEERWLGLYENSIRNESRRLFAASATHLDDNIGRLLSTLIAEDLYESTLVIFFSDNGAQEKKDFPPEEYKGKFRSLDHLGDNRPLRGWKFQLYEGGIRVPALVSWPGRIQPRRVTGITSVDDVFPTIAGILKAPIPPTAAIDGQNAWPLITGESAHGERVLYWRAPNQCAIREGNWKLIHNGRSLDRGEPELYELLVDPYETHNVAKSNAAKTKELYGLLARLLR